MDAIDIVQQLELDNNNNIYMSGNQPDQYHVPDHPASNSSDFLLRRVVRSLASVVVQQASETEMPARNLTWVFSYLVSPFALLCMGMAIILNRTMVFATTRRPTELPFLYRFLLRATAVYSLAIQLGPLFASLKCNSPQTIGLYVPDWLCFGTQGMCPSPPILWDLYRSICVGHFIETFSSVIQGRIPYSETGMTLFEYSVAFQEVQSSQRLSVEILVVSILSALSQLALHVQGMFNSYQYRLIPSAVFGTSFLCYFAYATYQGRLFYFPTICVIGYLPQLAISLVVVVCMTIYVLACIFVGGPQNMQTSVASFNWDLSEDFYSFLMKSGVLALTSVTKATYLTEAASLSSPLTTWIEAQHRPASKPTVNPYKNEVLVGGGGSDDLGSGATSSRLNPSSSENSATVAAPASSGLLIVRRMVTAMQMIQALGSLVLVMSLRFVRTVLRIPSRNGRHGLDDEKESDEDEEHDPVRDEINSIRGQVIYAKLNDDYSSGYLDLLSGDLIPDFDDSIDYNPDDERTSVEDGEVGYEYETDFSSGDEEGVPFQPYTDTIRQRIPFSMTAPGAAPPHEPQSQRSSAFGELYDLIMSTPDALLSLLGPQSNEEKEHAKILSSHLAQPRMTRSQYKQKLHREAVGDETAKVLELIQERRQRPLPDNSDQSVLQSVCVVCQSQPRQVVLWPCRCFALCEECRLGLAVKNFKGCVCCRRNVDSFSRVFVP